MVKVCIEVVAGSRDKNFYDERTLEYKETRQVSQPYPYPYGFIIGTRGQDGDSIDCYIITRDELKPGALVECVPIGLLEQFEGEELDHKVLACIPSQEVEPDLELWQELRDFISAIFARFPEIKVKVGPILPREKALEYIQAHLES